MDDYLSEKDQWEWIKSQVRENGVTVLLAIAIVAGAVFGWRTWQQHLDTRRLEAGARYLQMVQALERGDRSQALVELGELERDYPGTPYTDQAKLLAGRLYVDDGELDRSAAVLTEVAEHSKDTALRLVARVRLARVQIAQGKADDALATLGAAGDPGAFAGSYHEVRGDAYYAKGERTAALNEYRSARASGSAGNATLLDLKIADLAAAGSAPAPAAAGPAVAPPTSSSTPAATK